MQIFSTDSHIQTILINRIYQKPLFKIIYTVIFCLSKRHSQIYQDQIKLIINQIVNTPFTYLNHKEKINQAKLKDNYLEISSPSKRKQNKTESEEGTTKFSPVRKKIVRKSNRNKQQKDSSPQSQKSAKTPTRLKHSLSLSNSFNPKKLSYQNHYQPQKLKNQQVQLQIYKKQSFPLNEDLDYSDLTYNMRDLFIDLTYNIKSIYLKNVLTLLQNFNQNYINSLLQNCKKYLNKQQYQGYCEGSICILQEFIDLYKTVWIIVQSQLQTEENNKSSNNHQSESNNESQNSNNISNSNKISLTITDRCSQLQNLRTLLMNKLQKELKIISSKIIVLYQCILENDQTIILYSSGQKLKKVGLIKFKMLQLIYQLLELNNPNKKNCKTSDLVRKSSVASKRLSNQQIVYPYIDLNINFAQIDLIIILEKYLAIQKWNNIIHKQLVKIMRLVLQLDYENFKEKYILSISKSNYKFLGHLVELFRNKTFVFLNNMKMSNYGNLFVIYELSQLVVKVVQQNNDYNLLIERFPSWQNFVEKDLSEYAKKLQISELINSRNLSQRQNSNIVCTVPGYDPNGKLITQSIQSIEQVLEQLQEKKRWNPNLNITKKKKSQTLIPVDSDKQSKKQNSSIKKKG